MRLRQRFSLQRFLQGEDREPGPITLVQRRVFILPTRGGIFFGVLLIVMLLGAINYNNSLAFTLTFLLASLSIVAMLHAYRNLLHLRVSVGHVMPVFCGETARVAVILDNPRPGSRYALSLRFAKQAPLSGDVPGGGWSRFDLPLPTNQRGRLPLPRITLRSSFPLGMFQAWSHVNLDSQLLIYPQPSPERKTPRETHNHLNLSGDRGRGSDDFAGLRTYQTGDSPHHLHWKAMAREQGLFTKQFGGDHAEELWLDWEALPGLDTEARLSQLARWVLDAEDAQHSYGLRLPGKQIPLGHGPAHRHRCLEALALFPGGAP